MDFNKKKENEIKKGKKFFLQIQLPLSIVIIPLAILNLKEFNILDAIAFGAMIAITISSFIDIFILAYHPKISFNYSKKRKRVWYIIKFLMALTVAYFVCTGLLKQYSYL